MEKILIIGAGGQLGGELTRELRKVYGSENVIASDLRAPEGDLLEGPCEVLDIMDEEAYAEVLEKYDVTQVYHLAAMLSAKAEQHPKVAWNVNMDSLLHVLDSGREKVKRIFWPSSIAVFGPDSPSRHTPQRSVMNPTTVYGISKLAGERWCEYYHHKYNVDVRSIRYPGLIGYKTAPGGGTTDYAVDIYVKAVAGEHFDCFLGENMELPMMYMDDAVRGTIELMKAEAESIRVRSSYNLASMSFRPKEVYREILKYYPDFKISYKPDFRQEIAKSWPRSIDDDKARLDWGWEPEYDLEKMTKAMIEGLKGK